MLPILAELDDWFTQAQADHPGVIPCRVGCTACCHGPFDISPSDAARVAEAVALLPAHLREPMRQRAQEQWATFCSLLPELPPAGDLDEVPDPALDRACERLARLPCPALNDQGACSIHSARPATCRMMGLGIQLPSGEVLDNPCPISASYPAYQALPPVPLDLLRVEDQLQELDQIASLAGWKTTTVAGAIARSS